MYLAKRVETPKQTGNKTKKSQTESPASGYGNHQSKQEWRHSSKGILQLERRATKVGYLYYFHCSAQFPPLYFFVVSFLLFYVPTRSCDASGRKIRRKKWRTEPGRNRHKRLSRKSNDANTAQVRSVFPQFVEFRGSISTR